MQTRGGKQPRRVLCMQRHGGPCGGDARACDDHPPYAGVAGTTQNLRQVRGKTLVGEVGANVDQFG
jgi:hypothetical protein